MRHVVTDRIGPAGLNLFIDQRYLWLSQLELYKASVVLMWHGLLVLVLGSSEVIRLRDEYPFTFYS